MGRVRGGWYEVYRTVEDASLAWWLLNCPSRAHQAVPLPDDFPRPLL